MLGTITDWWEKLTRPEQIAIVVPVGLALVGAIVKVIWDNAKKKAEDCPGQTTVGDSQKVEKIQAKTVTAMQDSVIDRSKREAGGPYIEHLTVNVAEGGKFELTLPAIDYQDGVSESPVPKVRELFEVGREHVKKGEFREAIGVFEACLGFEKDNEKRGAIYIQTGNCYYRLRRYQEAGRFYSDGLEEAQKAGDIEGQGSALGSIANTFMLRPAADGATRGNNVREAVKCYKKALKFFSRDEYPVDYATTQNNLGNAYTDLPSATAEERAKNVRSAIACFKAALEIYAKDEYPVDYAMTQNNLANAYTDLLSATADERAGNVRSAIACYKAALEIYKKDEYPVQYAGTQNNLGLALTYLPSATAEERAKNVRKAIACYKAALEIYKKDAYPVDYAMTQNNLGSAYTDLPSATAEERAGNVRSAIACYKVALEIRKKYEYPQYYCQTAANLGIALADIDKTKACYWLKEAYALREFLPDQGKGLVELIEKVCE